MDDIAEEVLRHQYIYMPWEAGMDTVEAGKERALRRELETELFGRDDTDNIRTARRLAADPMHPARLPEPMRWLTAEPGRLRLECTGFGLNLVSGNFEFASLVVIESDNFWSRYVAEGIPAFANYPPTYRTGRSGTALSLWSRRSPNSPPAARTASSSAHGASTCTIACCSAATGRPPISRTRSRRS